jgi:hypothetical protein
MWLASRHPQDKFVELLIGILIIRQFIPSLQIAELRVVLNKKFKNPFPFMNPFRPSLAPGPAIEFIRAP